MKVSEIQVGGIYHDGKLGVREVTNIERRQFAADRVTYTLLAAKAERGYSYAEKREASLLGQTNACDLESFARWARVAVPKEQKAALLASLVVKKMRLPLGETAFMISVAESFDDATPVTAGTTVSFDFRETRTARGIEKKGLATVAMAPPGAGGEIKLTELGAEWVRAKRGAVAAAN